MYFTVHKMQQPKFWIICLSLIMNELAFEENDITQRRHSRNICVMISYAGILEQSVGVMKVIVEFLYSIPR